MLRLGPMGELITAHGGYYELTNDSFLREIADTVLSSPRHLGVLSEYNLRYYKSENPLNPCIVFADMTSENSTLHNLVLTCMIIGIAGFGIFLALSILLSHWITAPVDSAFKKQRQFIADASHELKTPLTVILTNTELMGDTAFTSNTPQLAVSTRTMALRMKELISRMLELAKTEPDADTSKKLYETFTDINLSDIAEESVLTFDAVFFEKGLTLHYEIDKNIHINGDNSMLTELIEIFLDNACKYSKKGGSTWLSLKHYDKSHCILSVANEGTQINSHDLANLFTRFYRADYSRSAIQGSGLGLAIAENIAQLHHTSIKVESADGINRFLIKFHTIFT